MRFLMRLLDWSFPHHSENGVKIVRRYRLKRHDPYDHCRDIYELERKLRFQVPDDMMFRFPVF